MVQGVGGRVDMDSNSAGKKGILSNTEPETLQHARPDLLQLDLQFECS